MPDDDDDDKDKDDSVGISDDDIADANLGVAFPVDPF
jgi:hypothetical protein